MRPALTGNVTLTKTTCFTRHMQKWIMKLENELYQRVPSRYVYAHIDTRLRELHVYIEQSNYLLITLLLK